MVHPSEAVGSGGRGTWSLRRLLVVTVLTANATAVPVLAIREGGCVVRYCEAPLCAQVAPPRIDDIPFDCYCVNPAAGIVRHLRMFPALRRIRFTGVVRGVGAEPDDYVSRPVGGGGHTVGLTGPISEVPVSLRDATALHASPDGVQVFVTLSSGRHLLIFDRDSEGGSLRYDGVACYGSAAELDRLLEAMHDQAPLPAPAE